MPNTAGKRVDKRKRPRPHDREPRRSKMNSATEPPSRPGPKKSGRHVHHGKSG
jgi:hypothetical protein